MIIGKRSTWKEIYEIENRGSWYKISSNYRIFVSTEGEICKFNKNTKNIIRTFGSKNKYLQTYIECLDCQNIVNFHVLIHRLVAYAFLEKKECDTDVNHKDGNPTNNNVNNLEWVTHIENVRHALDTGLTPMKHTKESIEMIAKLLMDGLSNKEVADIMTKKGYECTLDQIYRIRNKDNYARFTEKYTFPTWHKRNAKNKELAIKVKDLMRAGLSTKEITKLLSLKEIYTPSQLRVFLYRIRHGLVWKDDLTT